MLVVVLVKLIGLLHEVAVRIKTEHEADAVVMPAVKMPCQREIGVTAQHNVPEARAATQFNGAVKVAFSPLR